MPLQPSLKFASEKEIMERAFELPGRKLRDLADWLHAPGRIGAVARGDVGDHVERLFGLRPNSSPDPDFPTAGIELKTVPLRQRARGWVPKERTTISMIDYVALGREVDWAHATVRKKLSKVLFVFFRWLPKAALAELVVDSVYLWLPTERQLSYFESDWKRIHSKVMRGQAHLLSDSDSFVLAATTKARDSRARRPQVPPGPPAKPRAFTLKQSFMDSVYRDESLRRANVESLIDNLAIRRLADFEGAVLARFAQFVGRRVGTVGEHFGVGGAEAKDYAARVIRRGLGATRVDARLREFEEFGIEIKIVPLRRHGRPWEALSFPAFKYAELSEETWDVAELRERLQRLLIVPVYSDDRGAEQSDRILGQPFFWSPSDDEWSGIQREWEMFKDEIQRGRADCLTPATETDYIHVRPHARDATDTDEAPVVGPVVKKSFWLNKDYIAAVISANDSV